MKAANALEDLHRQWPRGLATLKDPQLGGLPTVLYGALVKDHATGGNRFGFVMFKLWGDLRSLINLCMERNNARGPPFFLHQVKDIMHVIAFDMKNLHKRGIIHRDLKASNVLFFPRDEKAGTRDLISDDDPYFIFPRVADWECCVGVMGTGVWRAPELLQQMKDRTPSSEILFMEKMDVYSFAMTCYEIVTGKLPFEGLPFYETRDAILDGARPELPHDLNPLIKIIITSCWHSDPSLRPPFAEITAILSKV